MSRLPTFTAAVSLAFALALEGPARASSAPQTYTLEEALRLLEEQNLTLKQAQARAAEARALGRQASAALWPTLAATGSFVRNSDSAQVSLGNLTAILGGALPPGAVPEDVIIQPLEAFSASAVLRVPLFAGHAWWDAAAARQAAEAAEASTRATRASLRAALEQSAWMVLAAEEAAQVAEQAVTTAEEHVRSAAAAVQAGTAIALVKLQAEAELIRRQSELARASAQRDEAYLALGALIAHDGPARIELAVEEDDDPELGDVEALIARAFERRPELQALQSQRRAAELQVAAAHWRHAPQLSASVSAFASDIPYPTGERSGWRATVDLTWALFDGGLRYGKARQGEARQAQAEAALREQRLAIAQEVRDAARELQVAKLRARLAEQQERLAAETAASAARGFAAGMATSLEVLDANDRQYLARVGLAAAKAEVGAARAALCRATGEFASMEDDGGSSAGEARRAPSAASTGVPTAQACSPGARTAPACARPREAL